MNVTSNLYLKTKAIDETNYNTHPNSLKIAAAGTTNTDSRGVSEVVGKANKEECDSTCKAKITKVCLPFKVNWELIDKGDMWRPWSCIILAYLLRNAVTALSNKTMIDSTNNAETQNEHNYRRDDRLKRRGRYLTRRQEKYSWQSFKNAWTAFKVI